jgi:hypothetical protein
MLRRLRSSCRSRARRRTGARFGEQTTAAGGGVELALAAVPVAVEDHRVRLGDAKASGGIQTASTSSRSQCSSRCASALPGSDSIRRTQTQRSAVNSCVGSTEIKQEIRRSEHFGLISQKKLLIS